MTGSGRRNLAGSATAVLAAALLAGCGSDAAGGGSTSDSPSVSITSPSEGDTVDGSFMVEWDSNVSLGEPETGRHHVHIFVDGNSSDYTVVGGDSFEVTGLSSGEHTVDVTLQNADHSSAGAEDQVDVTVSESGDSGSDSGSDSGGGRYHY